MGLTCVVPWHSTGSHVCPFAKHGFFFFIISSKNKKAMLVGWVSVLENTRRGTTPALSGSGAPKNAQIEYWCRSTLVGLLGSIGLMINLLPLSEKGLGSNHLSLLERVFDLSTAVLSKEPLPLCVEVGLICLFWREGIFSLCIPSWFCSWLGSTVFPPFGERG
jgi:hypothetical protein